MVQRPGPCTTTNTPTAIRPARLRRLRPGLRPLSLTRTPSRVCRAPRLTFWGLADRLRCRASREAWVSSVQRTVSTRRVLAHTVNVPPAAVCAGVSHRRHSPARPPRLPGCRPDGPRGASHPRGFSPAPWENLHLMPRRSVLQCKTSKVAPVSGMMPAWSVNPRHAASRPSKPILLQYGHTSTTAMPANE